MIFQGDSGGPLITRHSSYTSYYDLIGIVSWSRSCGIAKYPGVYTRVTSKYLINLPLKLINTFASDHPYVEENKCTIYNICTVYHF